MWRTLSLWAAVVVALLALPGCTKRQSANIVSHPGWEYQDYKRIAVLPFRIPENRPEAVPVARLAEDQLVSLLTTSGAFGHVARRSDLAAIMTEQDLARVADVADPSTAPPEGMIQIAQALVIGTLTEIDLRRERREESRPVWALNQRGVPYIAGHEVVLVTRHVARLAGSVRVVDTATGRTLLSYACPPIEKDDAAVNAHPRATPDELALDLARELGTDLFRRLAPQSLRVKLDGDCLLVAREYFEGKYSELKKVPDDLPAILVVARALPRECDRNPFRLAISPKDERHYLFEHEFVWSPSLGGRGMAAAVPVELLAKSGYRKFTAKLFSGHSDSPMLQRDFELVRPRAD